MPKERPEKQQSKKYWLRWTSTMTVLETILNNVIIFLGFLPGDNHIVN